MAWRKCPAVKGLRVEIFLRPLQKNTTRPLMAGQGGAVKRGARGVQGGTPCLNSKLALELRREQIIDKSKENPLFTRVFGFLFDMVEQSI